MRRWIVICLFFVSMGVAASASAQCSICSRTVQQLGAKPAQGLNVAIIYLMFAPLGIMGFIGYRWWRNEYGAPLEEEGTPKEP